MQYERQKAFYDQKIHWDPYTQGDLVWLHSSSVFVGSCIMSGRCLFKHFSVYPMVIIILIVSVRRSKYRLFTLITSSCAHQGLSSWTIPSLIKLRQTSMNWIHLLLGQIKLEVIQQMSRGPQFCLGILLGINRLQASKVTIFPLVRDGLSRGGSGNACVKNRLTYCCITWYITSFIKFTLCPSLSFWVSWTVLWTSLDLF